MKRYLVQSGPLRLTIAAPSPYDAALEAVRWWDERRDPSFRPKAGAEHRAQLDAAIEVRPHEAARRTRRYPTFNLLARAAGESPARAWQRVLATS